MCGPVPDETERLTSRPRYLGRFASSYHYQRWLLAARHWSHQWLLLRFSRGCDYRDYSVGNSSRHRTENIARRDGNEIPGHIDSYTFEEPRQREACADPFTEAYDILVERRSR